MAKPLVSDLLKQASKLKTKAERVAHLQKNGQYAALRDILRINFDDSIESLLPEGAPPYKEDEMVDGHNYSNLHKEFRKFKYFFNGPTGRALNPARRERLFIELLETIHANEAEMLVLAKDKKLKYLGITKKLVSDAFPGLIVK